MFRQLNISVSYKTKNLMNFILLIGTKNGEAYIRDKCPVCTKKGGIITETIDRQYYLTMHLRMQSRKAKRLMKKRQSTVEPVIGTLVNYLGMKKVNTKGLMQANKCMTMAAVAYNLKKLLKHSANNAIANLQALKQAGRKEETTFTLL
jgi:Transposase DDE domain